MMSSELKQGSCVPTDFIISADEHSKLLAAFQNAGCDTHSMYAQELYKPEYMFRRWAFMWWGSDNKIHYGMHTPENREIVYPENVAM